MSMHRFLQALQSRRKFSARLLLALLPLPFATKARAQVNPVSEALQKMGLRPEGVQIELAPLSDTGNAVPFGVTLKAPAGLSLVSFEITAPENPAPRVIRIRLGQPGSSYHFATRIRLGTSQDIWVVATLSDGSRIGAHAPTVVTSSACFDGT